MWPTQSACDTFYGNPRGRNGGPSAAWESANLIRVTPPFVLKYMGKPVKTVTVHKKCADSLLRVLNNIWETASFRQSLIDEWGMSTFGGAYNYRLMRGGSRLSMHAYGCALDFDPDRNAMGDTTPKFLDFPWVIRSFEKEGWVWGGRWSGRSCDGMHFQAARVG